MYIDTHAHLSMLKNFLRNLKFKLSRRPSSAELALFAKELKFLLQAGIPLLKCFSIILRQVTSARMKASITRLKTDISSGLSFSQSLRAQKDIFPEIFINIVAAGETGGMLEQCLLRIADYFETKDNLKKKIVSATVYPSLVMFLSFVSVIFITVYLVPTMNGIFSGLGIELPYLTRIISGLGSLILNFWHVILLSVLITSFVTVRFLKRVFGNDVFERVLFRLPIVSRVINKMILSRVSSTLSTLLSAGVPLIPSLSIASAVSGSSTYRRAFTRVIESIEGGERLSLAFKKAQVFPESFYEMVYVGESSGRLEDILGDLAGYYEREVESQLKVIVSLVEPASTLLVGAVVGVVVFSMFLPIIGMLDSLVK